MLGIVSLKEADEILNEKAHKCYKTFSITQQSFDNGSENAYAAIIYINYSYFKRGIYMCFTHTKIDTGKGRKEKQNLAFH